MFVLFEQRGKVLEPIHHDFFNERELSYKLFATICFDVWKIPQNLKIILLLTYLKKIQWQTKNWLG